MKKIVLILVLLFSVNSYSQKFEFNKVIANGILLKAEGTLKITDSLITINVFKSKEPEQTYHIKKVSENGSFKQYRSDVENAIEPIEVRFTLKETNIYKKYPFQLTLDGIDTFTNQNTQVIYIIREIKE